MKIIDGGVCAANGFLAGGVHAGLRKNKSKRDLAFIGSGVICNAAGVFTRNRVKAAPVLLDIEKIKLGKARCIVVNSGNANACAPNDMENARRMSASAAKALGVDESLVLIGSTGVIGQELPVSKIEDAMQLLIDTVSTDASELAAEGIMTTDTMKKEIAAQFECGGVTCKLGGIAKGSGMIHPNMGTMLCYITTDCAISSEMLQTALSAVTERTFNRVTVDGDTSTNDTCLVLANGMAGGAEITSEGEDYAKFYAALHTVMEYLSREVARDGEGATHLMTCTVSGATDEKTAETLAKSVVGSSLVKAMIFGADANFGRVLCAMGYSGIDFDPNTVDISFRSAAGEIIVAKSGTGLEFDEDTAKKVLTEEEVEILVTMAGGTAAPVSCWGCDLTYDYVKINGDYRS